MRIKIEKVDEGRWAIFEDGFVLATGEEGVSPEKLLREEVATAEGEVVAAERRLAEAREEAREARRRLSALEMEQRARRER